MKIVEVQINKIQTGKVVAQAKINFGWFWLAGFKVVDGGESKKYVTPPSYKSSFGWKALFTTVKKSDWKEIQSRILEAYEEWELEESTRDM